MTPGHGTEQKGRMASPDFVEVVFDGPPGHNAPHFVEVEDGEGRSIKFGEWVQHDDGYWALRFQRPDRAMLEALVEAEDLLGFHEGSATVSHPGAHPSVWINNEDLERVLRSLRAALRAHSSTEPS